jgi:ribosomal-protein-alanine N-acetyltransferase
MTENLNPRSVKPLRAALVTLRPMAKEDLDRVVELEQAIFPSPWQRSFFLSDMNRPRSLALVADDGGVVAGYVIAWGEDEVHVANIAVAPEFRRRGVGLALMRAVEESARNARANSLYLEVRRSNETAQSFYRGLGFVLTYIRQGYYENGEDALVMERDVAPQG